MNIKHRLFICGTHFDVWGPESREMTVKLFLSLVAEKTKTPLQELLFGAELMEDKDLVNPIAAYRALPTILNYVKKCRKIPIVVRHDKFLSSSSRSLARIPMANAGLIALNQLAETVVARRQSLSDGTTSKPLKQSIYMIVSQWMARLLKRSTLQPQTLILVLAITSVFGYLLVPIR